MSWTQKAAKQLSKDLSYYLRHKPWEAELIPDEAGWVPVAELINALNDTYAGLVTLDAIKEVIRTTIDAGGKDRFEISEDETRIRARYGHSFKVLPPDEPSAVVPHILYHGTTVHAAALIEASMSIKPMQRQFVHWATEVDLARTIAKRHGGKKRAMFFLDAAAAHAEGIDFYDCKNGIWLTPEVPLRFTTRGPDF